MPKTSLVYSVSLVLHGALAIGVLGIHEKKRREIVAISVAEAKKKAPEPPKVEPIKQIEKQPEAPAKAKPRPAAAAPKIDAAPPPDVAPKPRSAALDALPNLGLSMGNDGSGGIGVPQGGPVAATPAPTVTAAAPKTLNAMPRPDDCTEALVKPKVKSTSQPSPTASAREAGIEGKVRVEVSVGPDGNVTGARLVAGLGYGLDEASLEAARRATFQPATRCGKPVAGTVVMAFRFQSQ